jgi:hypothetical protein
VDDRVSSAPSDQRAELRAMLDIAPVPRTRPAYGRFLAGTDGNLWVSGYAPPDAEASSWDIFAPDGLWLGTVENPLRLRLLAAGSDWLLASSLDSLGEEHVELRRWR